MADQSPLEDQHQTDTILPVSLEDEMERSFIDYAMSVIVKRALPDVRDGLKPVHRRILYAMAELGVFYDKPYKKTGRIVGDVLGKYHPHGDAAIYGALVRMAQAWSLRYPLVQGQGNFGSLDGDAAASMRYTEARLTALAQRMLEDLGKETVDFRPNFDDSLKEPDVLPALLPNLLMNGGSGIAVGMATNMAPHNLEEIISGAIAYIDDKAISIEQLMHHIKAPDFPTGGIIYGFKGVREAFLTGHGRVVLRGVCDTELLKGGRTQLVVTEIPYMVNKAVMLEKTIKLIQDKQLDGISTIRDESSRKGVRVVYELKKDAVPQVVLNNLYKHTELQSSFSINNVALVDGRPERLNLKQLLVHYIDHRHDVINKRTGYEHRQATQRLHILEGYQCVLRDLNQAIALIKAAKDGKSAQADLIAHFALSQIQAKSILELKLQRLTGLERDKIAREHQTLMKRIQRLEEILGSKEERMALIREELLEIKSKYPSKRRTQIVYHSEAFVEEDMIPNERMVITISHQGYIKRTPLDAYRSQNRGGVGARGVATKESDLTTDLFVASSHDYLLILTKQGHLYWLKVYKLPEGGKNTQGRAIQNLIEIDPKDKITCVLPAGNITDPSYYKDRYVFFATARGQIKKTALEAYSRPRSKGIRAINIAPGDRLLDAKLGYADDHIVLALKSGKAIRFPGSEVRPMGRTAAGVRGIRLGHAKDEVVNIVRLSQASTEALLVVSERGYGKRSAAADYRTTHRGGQGIKTLQVTAKTGSLVALKAVKEADDLMIITEGGVTIRMAVSDISVIGRATQGVKLIDLRKSDQIASIEVVAPEPTTASLPDEAGAAPAPEKTEDAALQPKH